MNLNEKIKYVENYHLEPAILERIQKEYKYTDYQLSLLVDTLKDYFIAHLLKRDRNDSSFITMASFHVDQVWHWFILFTPQYREFCNYVFGDYLDHVPTVGVVPTKEFKDQTYFNTLNYLKEIKSFRHYSEPDLNELNTIDTFYSIFAIDYIISGLPYFEAIQKSCQDLEI